VMGHEDFAAGRVNTRLVEELIAQMPEGVAVTG
jgi:hypothetical protein